MSDKDDKEKNLENKLNTVLNKKDCVGDECIIDDQQELVHRENKKIITNDGRQLLSEYTTK